MVLGKGLNSLIPKTKGVSRKIVRKETGGSSEYRIWHIPISEIIPNKEQPRKNFAEQDLNDLVESIKIHGVLQPIMVTEQEDGGYELIAGERRFRASQLAGLNTIPTIVRTASHQEKLELALIENIQRQDLNPIEEAFAFNRLIQEFCLTQEQVAKRVGKSRSAVANIVRLLGLPESIQQALIDGALSMGKARALLSLKDQTEQVKVFEEMVGTRVTVRDVERAVESKGVKSRKGLVRRDPNIRAQETLLEERFGTRVEIIQKNGKGSIMIHFDSKEELKRLMQDLT